METRLGKGDWIAASSKPGVGMKCKIRDEVRLKEYLHRYRRIWNDQSKARGVA